MVMATTAPLVCNKIMFTQALNVSGGPAPDPPTCLPALPATLLRIPAYVYWVILMSELPRFSTCPLAWGPKSHACLAAALSWGCRVLCGSGPLSVGGRGTRGYSQRGGCVLSPVSHTEVSLLEDLWTERA